MVNINLLPPDLGPKASVLRLAAVLKKTIVGALTLFCFFSVLTIAYIVFLDIRIKKVGTENEVLKKSIKSLEQTEQKLFLVKDRLGIIKSLSGGQEKEAGFGGFERILTEGMSGVSLVQINALPGKIEVSGGFSLSRALGSFLEGILVNPDYKTVDLTSFSYNPVSGYSFELEVSIK